MKMKDKGLAAAVAILLLIACLSSDFVAGFRYYSTAHGYLLSFVKFAILATFGECLALRIVTGKYWVRGFGLCAKMIVWGFLGIIIKLAFTVFATGAPNILASFGFDITPATLATGGFFDRVAAAFIISASLNCIFAPVLMVLHKITDAHIHLHGGKLSAVITPIKMADRFKDIDWNIMWGLVLKKTIPFFWIPAHTITFLLPPDFRILFAAFLGVALGVILAFANLSAAQKVKA
ncbi:Mpv17/PMP22 family protein [Halodesulfovibrio marinisediminis]|uniref:Mpv17 / PMP22 family protein n=1 Tax=Halodesulfovibrio marinisediminis DSM 17456 TaxID=1121457 RepID=A0A1N6GXA9_9BACT|nr:Mpv17/PMP22 family protein [Halodesulfovibrio marinisediminis]SIO12188.1 Mpv17 / PMP22 family protein [Halodesulfovibrio marinisediminis DSM 17456]